MPDPADASPASPQPELPLMPESKQPPNGDLYRVVTPTFVAGVIVVEG